MKGVSDLYDNCLRDSTVFLAKEPGGCVNNAIICCARPADPVVHAVCVALFQRILVYSSASDWPGPLVVTGPVAISSIISANHLAAHLAIECEGPLVFGAGSKGAVVRSAKFPSEIMAGTVVVFISSRRLTLLVLKSWRLLMLLPFTCL
jgi:hypothetical protein